MDEDRILKERYGTENHFTVPEGFFDDFASRVMANLPEQQAKEIKMPVVHKLWRRFGVAAAGLVLLAVGATVWFGQAEGNDAQEAMGSAQAASLMSVPASEIEQAADYAMLDNSDIYAYLAAGE